MLHICGLNNGRDNRQPSAARGYNRVSTDECVPPGIDAGHRFFAQCRCALRRTAGKTHTRLVQIKSICIGGMGPHMLICWSHPCGPGATS